MNINWKLRLKNRATLVTLCVSVVTAAYCVLGALGIAPGVSQEAVMNLVYAIVAILCALGIVVDPTTQGVSDSEQAMGYDSPKCGEDDAE